MIGNLMLIGFLGAIVGIILSLVNVFRRKEWWIGLLPIALFFLLGIAFNAALGNVSGPPGL